jgi:hypothetical protein
MSNGELPAYDAAQKDRKNDDLGRWRFAAEIAEVIRSTPPEGSARIGIFGKWGEGKSTILYFLEEMLKPDPEDTLLFIEPHHPCGSLTTELLQLIRHQPARGTRLGFPRCRASIRNCSPQSGFRTN